MLWRKRCLHVAAVMRIFTSGPSEYNRHRALKERPASRELYVRKFREYLVAIYSGLPVVFLQYLCTLKTLIAALWGVGNYRSWRKSPQPASPADCRNGYGERFRRQ